MGIFYRRRRRFPAAVLDKVASERLTASDQAVMGVGERKGRQEGNRLAASSADAAPNSNPVVVFIMGLFATTTMTDDLIPRANWAATKDCFGRGVRPIGYKLARRLRT